MTDTGEGELLFETGVLTTDDGTVTTTDDFESEVAEYAEEVAAHDFEDVVERVRDRLDRDGVVEPFAELGTDDPRTLGEAFALRDRLEPPRPDDWLSLIPVLRLFRPQEVPTDGVPESFVPVPATHVPHLARIYSPAVVYVWLDDCPPCETVKADLESIFEEPRGVMPFAVYGPNHKAFLRKEYDVTAGPALLFVREGRIDSRLYGAQPRQTIESELSKISE